MSDDNGLIPGLGGGTYYLYPKPNPAFTEILLGSPLHDLVDEWGLKVEMTYMAALQGRKHDGDRHPGNMAGAIESSSFIGGYESDRWVGQMTVHVDYALADEYGRSTPASGQHGSTYEGTHSLRDSLHANLPPI